MILITEKLNPVEHYAKLALQDGWIDYVRHQVKEMEKDHSGLWVGLAQAIADKIKELNESVHH
jgi:hypothetical protein